MNESEYIDTLLKYIFILNALREGWHVRLLNDKTFEFSKQKTEVDDVKLCRSKYFIQSLTL